MKRIRTSILFVYVSLQLYFWSIAKKGIQKFTKSADGQLLGPCNRIRKDGAGDIWLMTDLHIYRFDREKEQFILFPKPL